MLRRNSQDVLGLTPAQKGDLLYRTPVDWVVVGLHLEWTAVDNFYLYALAVPLFVPATVLSLSVGERLPRPNSSIRRWPPRWRPELGDADDQLLAAMRSALTDAQHLLDSIATPDGYVRYVDQRRLDPTKLNPIYREQAAYASLIGGQSDRGVRRQLNAVLEAVDACRHDRYGSPGDYADVTERVHAVIDSLAQGRDPMELLRGWRRQRVERLGLLTGVTDDPS